MSHLRAYISKYFFLSELRVNISQFWLFTSHHLYVFLLEIWVFQTFSNKVKSDLWDKASFILEWKWSDMWPILWVFCALHFTHSRTYTHTHTHTHTHWAVGNQCCSARGAAGGLVPCSGVSPQSWHWRWRNYLQAFITLQDFIKI